MVVDEALDKSPKSDIDLNLCTDENYENLVETCCRIVSLIEFSLLVKSVACSLAYKPIVRALSDMIARSTVSRYPCG